MPVADQMKGFDAAFALHGPSHSTAPALFSPISRTIEVKRQRNSEAGVQKLVWDNLSSGFLSLPEFLWWSMSMIGLVALAFVVMTAQAETCGFC